MNAEQVATSSTVNENTCHSVTVTFCELNSGKETEPYIVSPAKIAEESSPSNEHEMKYAVSISQMYITMYVRMYMYSKLAQFSQKTGTAFITSTNVLPSKNQAVCEYCTHVIKLKDC